MKRRKEMLRKKRIYFLFFFQYCDNIIFSICNSCVNNPELMLFAIANDLNGKQTKRKKYVDVFLKILNCGVSKKK